VIWLMSPAKSDLCIDCAADGTPTAADALRYG
jgi:hypothetical protein